MTDEANDSDAWLLGDAKRGDLTRLAQVVRELAPKAECATDLIVLGEAWQAIEQILEGQTVDVDVGFDVGFRRGSDKFEEGLFMCCRINDEEVLLTELKTTYASDVGSDHSSSIYARLSRGGRWDGSGFNKWLDKLTEVRSFEDARLDTERDHV